MMTPIDGRLRPVATLCPTTKRTVDRRGILRVADAAVRPAVIDVRELRMDREVPEGCEV